MSLLDSLRSMFGSSSGQNRGAIRGKVNIDERFERMRYSSSGTMSNFFVARDRENDKIIGVKLCDAVKVSFFENRFRGLNKPTEGEIAMGMRHRLIVETYEYAMSRIKSSRDAATASSLRSAMIFCNDGPSINSISKKGSSLVDMPYS